MLDISGQENFGQALTMLTSRQTLRDDFFKEALRSLIADSKFSSNVSISELHIDAVVRSGLGPIFFHLLAGSGNLSEIDKQMKLKASDITARILTAEQFQNVARVIELLLSRDVDIIVLKGTSFALKYYPEPHLRTMGDIDLLLSPDKISSAEEALVNDGFEKSRTLAGVNYDEHIHSAPLFHPDRKIWIELHRRILPAHFPASQENPLNLKQLEKHLEDAQVGPQVVRRFRPEFELFYLASSWCFDLTNGVNPGLRRGLVDCALLLKSAAKRFDWDSILRWSKNTLAGASLYILLSYLVRCSVYNDGEKICNALRCQQNFVNSKSLELIHRRLEKHLVGFEEFGPLFTSNVTTSLMDALIRKNAAWKNLLAIPGSIMFPRREPRRFQLRYQLGRLGTAFKLE